MSFMLPINLKQFIQDNRDKLQPPVCNKIIWEDSEFIVMVIGGPNNRGDYHVDLSDEFFYQVQGDMVLKIIENDEAKDIAIKEGEVFMLPANIPHSPQRFKDTIGIVIERKRNSDEKDGFQWYCENCGNKLYEEYLHVSNITKQLPEIFARYANQKVACIKC